MASTPRSSLGVLLGVIPALPVDWHPFCSKHYWAHLGQHQLSTSLWPTAFLPCYVLDVGSMSTLRTSCHQSTRLTSRQLSAARSPDSPCYRWYWMQAFIVYAAAVVSADPSMALELLAYALTVIRASQHFDGLHWRAYDTHYRINAAALGNRSWSNLDTDLYTPFLTGREKPAALCSYCDSSALGLPTSTRPLKRIPQGLQLWGSSSSQKTPVASRYVLSI